MIAGTVSSFLMGLIRANKPRFVERCGEGLTCALLSTGLISISDYFFPGYPQSAIFVGVFVGFLGSDYLTSLVQKIISYLLERIKPKDEKDE